MTKITTYNRGIIIDGHADTKEECETITLLCDSLAKDKNFKQVAYDDGYAAFERIGKAERLRFVKAGISVIFDNNITKVTCVMGDTTTSATTSGETIAVGIADADFTVELAPGYELATAVSEAGSTITITGNSFHYDWKVGSSNDTITLTSKAASATGETWLLNEDLRTTARVSKNFTVSFESNGTNYTALELLAARTSTVLNYNSTKVYEDAVVEGTAYWYAQAYRTVTFSTAPTGDLLAWLQENGTKQSSKLSVDLTTLSGWANLSSGSHTIKIVAKGTGYRDSEKSGGVEVVKPAEVYTDCLTFTGESSEFTLKATNKTWDGTLEWSTDHNTWTTLTGTEAMQSVGKKLYLRGKGNTIFYDNKVLGAGVNWRLSAKAGCSGNIQTLLDWENPPTSIRTTHCYRLMFGDCANLTSAPVLLATTLEEYCYYYMFYNCTNLKVNTTSGTKIFTCPSTIPTNAVVGMFSGTGGSFTGTPTAGNTYYWTE